MRSFLKFKSSGVTNILDTTNIARIFDYEDDDYDTKSKIVLKQPVECGVGQTVVIYADETTDELYKKIEVLDYI